MPNSIIRTVCISCERTEKEAREYIEDEIRNLLELRDLGNLRSSDLEVSCDNLGMDHDFVEYFLHVLAS